jgi:uncharacterized protein (DUF924 family)
MDDFNTILDFWFKELSPADWWKKNPALDHRIRERFANVHLAAAAGETYMWRKTAGGRLAEVIVLDQFSRNMFRDSPRAFAQDSQALVLAQEAVLGGHDQALEAQKRSFLYMPFMHSESAVVHAWAEELFLQPGMEFNLDFERRHKHIIERFGRYPHRNDILGRITTAEEVEFLKEKGSSF